MPESRVNRAPDPAAQFEALRKETPSEYADRVIGEQERMAKKLSHRDGTLMTAVNHPLHYNTGNIEVIDFLDDQNFGPYEWQVVKYICRAKHKGKELEDLKKARWYLDRRIKEIERKQEEGTKPETTGSK